MPIASISQMKSVSTFQSLASLLNKIQISSMSFLGFPIAASLGLKPKPVPNTHQHVSTEMCSQHMLQHVYLHIRVIHLIHLYMFQSHMLHIYSLKSNWKSWSAVNCHLKEVWGVGVEMHWAYDSIPILPCQCATKHFSCPFDTCFVGRCFSVP